jgi:formylglycine-generating enzyme required for sulfatase activity
MRKFWEASEFGKFTEPDAWEFQKQFPNRPVVGVSWFEAAAYCAWAGSRLPTEAEWERVARGPKGSKYPWGDEPPLDHSRANYASAIGHPTPVGLFPEGNSPETICDLLGNVWEWCSDSCSAYQESPQSNPVGPKKGEVKIVRGGSWSSNRRDVWASVLSGYERTNRGSNMGFRCVGELS